MTADAPSSLRLRRQSRLLEVVFPDGAGYAFTFEFLRSGRPVDTYASVFMVKQGQRVAHLRIEAWQSSPDKPIAIGHGNFMVKPGAQPKEAS